MNSPLFAFILELVSPPTLNILLVIIGFLFFKKNRLIGQLMILISLIALIMLSLTPVSLYLSNRLESTPAISASKIKQLKNEDDIGRVIVVIGGGRYANASEYGEIDTLNAISLERVRYAAWLQKKLDIPVLLSGGSPNNEATSEAVLMNQVMMSSFGIAPKWIESNSSNLLQSAQFSAVMLEKAGLTDVVLVTHAEHMSIAVEAFRKNGLNVTPAPLGFTSQSSVNRDTFLPNVQALHTSTRAIKGLLSLFYIELID